MAKPPRAAQHQARQLRRGDHQVQARSVRQQRGKEAVAILGPQQQLDAGEVGGQRRRGAAAAAAAAAALLGGPVVVP